MRVLGEACTEPCCAKFNRVYDPAIWLLGSCQVGIRVVRF
ncbi:hypothetical protein GA0070613_5626 [Micromonospora inositola]|uniref:Uncharacterized protein n=1 Tax=Micromonospora inositola TaxID=47865 RepID=A0A1C5JW74_9ACTN|nr:hypothetical protein GA0070613_5626 [Micromonospora inositola]